MSAQRFFCSSIVPGKVDGPALVSNEAICFYLVEPETGILLERGHCLEGHSLEGTVLVAHAGKGSSVVQMDGLFKIIQRSKGPAAVVLRNPDPVFVSALLVMEIPSVYAVDETFYDVVRDCCRISMNGYDGTLDIYSNQDKINTK